MQLWIQLWHCSHCQHPPGCSSALSSSSSLSTTPAAVGACIIIVARSWLRQKRCRHPHQQQHCHCCGDLCHWDHHHHCHHCCHCQVGLLAGRVGGGGSGGGGCCWLVAVTVAPDLPSRSVKVSPIPSPAHSWTILPNTVC